MQINVRKTHYDRRLSQRERILETVRYADTSGALQRGELINLGNGGARLITCSDLEVGDKFMVLHRATNTVTLRSDVEVRWTKSLPCGLRQVVGVKELKTTILPTRSRSTVRLG